MKEEKKALNTRARSRPIVGALQQREGEFYTYTSKDIYHTLAIFYDKTKETHTIFFIDFKVIVVLPERFGKQRDIWTKIQ